MYTSVYDRRDDTSDPSPSPSPPSLTSGHMCIGYRNPNWQSLPKSARLTYLSVYDNRDRGSETALFSPPPSSLTHVHNIQTPTLPTPTLLTFTYTQVLWFLSCLTRPRTSVVRLDPSFLAFNLSLYRHPFIYIICRSRFTSYYNKQTSCQEKPMT